MKASLAVCGTDFSGAVFARTIAKREWQFGVTDAFAIS